MKHLLTLFLALSFCQLFAQKTYDQRTPTRSLRNITIVDSGQLRVIYKYTLSLDTIDKKTVYDKMALEIGRSRTRFYSTYALHCDSLNYLAEINDEQSVSTTGWMGEDQVATYEDFYFSYPAPGTLTSILTVGVRDYYYEQAAPAQKWEILYQTSEILGYQCFKATCNWGGRKWTAWFSLDIPFPYGPWKLCGLPGLILRAEDNNGLFKFEAEGIENYRGPIYAFDLKKKKMRKITYAEARKLLRLRWQDPVGVYASAGIPMVSEDATGKVTELKPITETYRYIPELELL